MLRSIIKCLIFVIFVSCYLRAQDAVSYINIDENNLETIESKGKLNKEVWEECPRILKLRDRLVVFHQSLGILSEYDFDGNFVGNVFEDDFLTNNYTGERSEVYLDGAGFGSSNMIFLGIDKIYFEKKDEINYKVNNVYGIEEIETYKSSIYTIGDRKEEYIRISICNQELKENNRIVLKMPCQYSKDKTRPYISNKKMYCISCDGLHTFVCEYKNHVYTYDGIKLFKYILNSQAMLERIRLNMESSEGKPEFNRLFPGMGSVMRGPFYHNNILYVLVYEKASRSKLLYALDLEKKEAKVRKFNGEWLGDISILHEENGSLIFVGVGRKENKFFLVKYVL